MTIEAEFKRTKKPLQDRLEGAFHISISSFKRHFSHFDLNISRFAFENTPALRF